MKRVFALLLAAMMLLSLTACGAGSEGNSKLTTFEMTCEPDGVETPAKVTVGYPKNFTKQENSWGVTLTDEAKDVEIDVSFVNDYNCYDINEEYAQEEYFFYQAATYGSYKGYVTRMDEESAAVDVYIYLDLVEELDDVYMVFYIRSASMDLDADPMALYKLPEVQQVLASVVYTAPAK